MGGPLARSEGGGEGAPPCVSSSGPHNSPSLRPEASPTEVPPSSRAQERSFFVRMKSTLTKRGLHVKASGYKVGALRVTAGASPPTPSPPPPPLQAHPLPAGHPRDGPPPGPRPGPRGPRPHAAPGPAG